MTIAWAIACSQAGPDLRETLASIRAETGVPALAVAVVSGDDVVSIAAVGSRRADHDDPVTVGDAWHLGSNTKAMTATVFALLCEAGVLGWDTTLAAAFPELAVHPRLREVTLEELLAHRGGLLPMTHHTPAALRAVFASPDEPRAQRAALAAHVLTMAPATEPGTYTYSNVGYIVVGAAMERATDASWESLVETRLFAPLGMTGCGFGPPALDRPGPWGHRANAEATFEPVPPDGPAADNPRSMGPASTVHCPLRDWARFASAHLAGERGDSALLDAASWRRLHEPVPDEAYAGGWNIVERRWAPGPILTHGGTNRRFTSSAWLAPGRDAAFLAVTNAPGSAAATALDRALARVTAR